MSNGIVYITIKDKKYTEYAYVSIESLRKTGYSGDICIITDSDDRSIKNVTYKQIPVSPDNPLTASRFLKTKLNTLSPFDTTLYLDCDTLVLNPIDSIWQYSKNNFNICRDHRFFLCDVNFFDIVGDQHELIKTKVHFPPDTPYYAGSVFMWNNSIDGNDVFTHWHDEWNVFKNTDQLALARAAFKNKLVVNELPELYNCSPTKYESYKTAQDNGVVIFAVWGPRRDYHILNYSRKELN